MHDVSALVGTTVNTITLNYQVTLNLIAGPGGQETVDALVILETPFNLKHDDQNQIVDPNGKETLWPVPALLHTNVKEADANDDFLTLKFDNGWQLTIEPHQQWESWHLKGKGVPQILVGPS